VSGAFGPLADWPFDYVMHIIEAKPPKRLGAALCEVEDAIEGMTPLGLPHLGRWIGAMPDNEVLIGEASSL